MSEKYNLTRLLKIEEIYQYLWAEVATGETAKNSHRSIELELSNGDKMTIQNNGIIVLEYKNNESSHRLKVWNGRESSPEVREIRTFMQRNGQEVISIFENKLNDLKLSALTMLKTAAVLTGEDISDYLENIYQSTTSKDWYWHFKNATHQVRAKLTNYPEGYSRSFSILVNTSFNNYKPVISIFGPDWHMWNYNLTISQIIYLKLKSEILNPRYEETNLKIKNFIANMDKNGIKMGSW